MWRRCFEIENGSFAAKPLSHAKTILKLVMQARPRIKLNHNILYSTFLWGYLWLPDQYFIFSSDCNYFVCFSSIKRFPYLSRIITVHLWCTSQSPREALDKKLLNYKTFTFKDFIFFYSWMPFTIKCSRENKLSYLAPWTSTTLYDKLL